MHDGKPAGAEVEVAAQVAAQAATQAEEQPHVLGEFAQQEFVPVQLTVNRNTWHLHGGNRGNRDQRGDQAVFDGGRAILVFQKAGENSVHGKFPGGAPQRRSMGTS